MLDYFKIGGPIESARVGGQVSMDTASKCGYALVSMRVTEEDEATAILCWAPFRVPTLRYLKRRDSDYFGTMVVVLRISRFLTTMSGSSLFLVRV